MSTHAGAKLKPVDAVSPANADPFGDTWETRHNEEIWGVAPTGYQRAREAVKRESVAVLQKKVSINQRGPNGNIASWSDLRLSCGVEY